MRCGDDYAPAAIGQATGRAVDSPALSDLAHGAGIAVGSNGGDLSVRDVSVLGERNDAEDSIDVYDRNAMLTVDNGANDLDALHDAGENQS